MQEIPIPGPREGEVLLKIRAASVNPVDYKIRLGKYPAVQADKLPYVLGRDAAGDVEACGMGVTTFVKGDPIYYLVSGIGYTFGHEKGSHEVFVLTDAGQVRFDPLT